LNIPFFFFFFFFFLWDWSLNSGLSACKAGTLLLEPHLQSIFAVIILEMGLENYLLGLASNCSPPNYSFPK
jgi:hypothetical protein